jgi:hypothetical protein
MRHGGIEENSPEYFRLLKLKQAEQKQEASKHFMATLIISLSSPAKTISISKLKNLKVEQLLEIGKAARAFHTALEKAGLVSKDIIKFNNRDF